MQGHTHGLALLVLRELESPLLGGLVAVLKVLARLVTPSGEAEEVR